MEIKKSTSVNIDEYEVLIRRRGEGVYASYCPQLNYMIKGEEHEEVQNKMWEYVKEYISTLEKN